MIRKSVGPSWIPIPKSTWQAGDVSYRGALKRSFTNELIRWRMYCRMYCSKYYSSGYGGHMSSLLESVNKVLICTRLKVSRQPHCFEISLNFTQVLPRKFITYFNSTNYRGLRNDLRRGDDTEDWKYILQWNNLVHALFLTQNLCPLILRLSDGLTYLEMSSGHLLCAGTPSNLE